MAQLSRADMDDLDSHYTGNCTGCDRCDFWPRLHGGEPGAAEAYAAFMAARGRPVTLVEEAAAATGAAATTSAAPEASAATRCLRCGSDRIVRGAEVQDMGEHVARPLTVKLGEAHPDAWLFAGEQTVEVHADLCGACGHVELRVADPEAMWEAYRQLPPQG